MLPGVRPAAEFFHIIAHRGHCAGMLGSRPAQEGDGIVHAPKRQQVAQLLQPGDHFDSAAALFANVVAIQFRQFAARRKKMAVVHKRVFHACFSQRGRQLRLPHALGQPGAARALPKMLRNEIAQPTDLFDLILRRNGDQNWLVESAAHHFHLAASGKRPDLIEVFGMAFGKPFEQGAGIVKPHAHERMPGQAVHKW